MEEYKLKIESLPELLDKWNKRLREGQFSHYEAERWYKKYHYIFGLPAITLSALVGSAFFFEGIFTESNLYKFFGVLSGFLSSFLISLQTFLNFSELAEKHLSAASKYGSVRRDVERLMVMISSGVDDIDWNREVDGIKKQIDDLAQSSPNVSKKVWKKSKKILKEEL